MSASEQLAVAQSCRQVLDDAGVRFALVCSFPDGGGALLCGGDMTARDENNATMPQLMRHYAKQIREGK